MPAGRRGCASITLLHQHQAENGYRECRGKTHRMGKPLGLQPRRWRHTDQPLDNDQRGTDAGHDEPPRAGALRSLAAVAHAKEGNEKSQRCR